MFSDFCQMPRKYMALQNKCACERGQVLLITGWGRQFKSSFYVNILIKTNYLQSAQQDQSCIN